ncbi:MULTISPECIES: ketopantoate reductase family protein [Idiomarina]|uniref:ketopantoate reductase family protein n=1 Tax=Idiomarina TaxID=135575 RepID=UPI001CD72CEB|nr:2-dehydropantoate 2-reductase [Idiomarina abyssalis]
MPIKYHWITLGPGAVSGLIASGLCDNGESVSVLSRHNRAATIEWQLVRAHEKRNYKVPATQLPIPKNSVFIVAVKAFDVISALQHITALEGFDKSMPIVLSHNGMVELPKTLRQLNLHPMVTTHGAVKSKNENGIIRIEHRGTGRSWLEVRQEESEPWSPLQHAFPPLVLEQNISQRRWLKLIINCVINPLTAIYGCQNGKLLEDKWQSQIVSLVNEAVAVAETQNVVLDAKMCHREVLKVAQETALNSSSMLQDIKQQRRTEIDQLTGYLIKTGESAGIATPTHQQLLNEFQKRYA